jgi:RNA polymerase sigma factor (sigma-70 family)
MSLTPSSRSILLRVYLEKRETLVRVFSKSLRDSALAEDIIQDMYVKIANFEGDYAIDNPTGFLFRMANNLYLNRLRSQTSENTRNRAWQEINQSQIGGEVVDDTPGAEAGIASRQHLQNLLGALRELPEKTQAIFRLHKFEGLSQPEVAARLEISISSVEKHLSQALRHLMTRSGRQPDP